MTPVNRTHLGQTRVGGVQPRARDGLDQPRPDAGSAAYGMTDGASGLL